MSESGFTLLELLIAVALLAIVASGFMFAVHGATASTSRLMNVQKERERVAGTRDDYLAKNDTAIKNDVANRQSDPSKPNYQSINVTVAGKTFNCWKISDEGTNLEVFVEKPTEAP